MKINIKIFVLYYLVSILFIFTNLNAKSRYNIKVGMNYSSFIGEKGNLEPGILFGIGKEWRIVKNTVLSCGILYYKQKTILNNKTIKPGYWDRYCIYVSKYNVTYLVGYLGIPLLIKQYFSFNNRDISVFVNAGIIFNIYAKDMSKKEYLGDISIGTLSEEEREKYNFDFRFLGIGENGSYFGSFFDPVVGLGFVWSRFQIEFQYQRKYIKWAGFIYTDKELESYNLMFSVNFQLFKASGGAK